MSNNLGVTRHVCLASHQSLGKFSTYGLLFLSSISQGISCRLELALIIVMMLIDLGAFVGTQGENKFGKETQDVRWKADA